MVFLLPSGNLSKVNEFVNEVYTIAVHNKLGNKKGTREGPKFGRRNDRIVAPTQEVAYGVVRSPEIWRHEVSRVLDMIILFNWE
jgi:hypothetical protein